MKKNFYAFIFSLFCVVSLQASEPQIWTIDTRAEVLRGESNGVSIDETGAISLAPKLTEIYKTEQPYVWSSAADANGNIYLGTGSDGRIFRVGANSAGKLFADLNELNVSALTIGKDGALYAGTSPNGKVYRVDGNGAASVFFDPQEKYIWSLAIAGNGDLIVGTGENGKIFRVKSANAAPASSLFYDTSETHIIALAVDRQGNIFAGTDGGGLVLRFGADGKPFALLDSSLREIHALAVGADNSVYALALSDQAATAKTPLSTELATATTEPNPTATPETPPKSRYDLTAAKSAVYRILPDGGNDVIWNSSNVVAFSIFPNPSGGVFVGTSDKGRIYSVGNDGRETLVLQSNENQISTIFGSGKNIFVTSSNQGKLYRVGAETVAEGVYESPVLDAKANASWGRIWWRSTGNIVLQTRSGNTERPNETWSDWSANYANPKDAQIASPKAKFLQWRAVLKNAGTLNEVSVAYLARNIAPEILSIQTLPTNVGFAANPPIQIDPNIENSGLDPTVFGLPPIANIPPRKIYQRGARSLQWTAEDRNGDKMEYSVYYKEIGAGEFKLLRDNMRESFFTIDGLAFADGRYVFKIAASDALSNPASLALSGERISEPIDIDNTAPTVAAIGNAQIAGNNAKVVFEASDAAGYLQNAEFSVNGGEWQTVYADDGISDGQRERYTLNVPLNGAGEFSITLRVFDASGNAGNARISVRK